MKSMAVLLLIIFNVVISQTFTEITTNLPELGYGSSKWGDYDNDGDLDIVMLGNSDSGYIGTLFRNDSGTFTDIYAGLQGTVDNSVDWGDYDNDGDLDIVMTGYYYDGDQHRTSNIYRNDSGIFTDINAGLIGISNGSASWGDYDKDGDLDILLTGGGISKIYRNNSGIFTDINTGLTGVSLSSSSWNDFDNDGDLDILLTGQIDPCNFISKIYRNDSGVFTDINADLIGVTACSVAWGDYDNDGDSDILLTGFSDSANVSIIYRNDSGLFTDIDAGLTGVYYGSADWGDYDNDGDLDILLTGHLGSVNISKIYRNDSGLFTDIEEEMTGVNNSSVAWGDYDNDGDLDILITGNYYDTETKYFSGLYMNNNSSSNTIPDEPTNLSYLFYGNEVILSWGKATDNETSQDGLTYNIYIGTESQNGNKLNPMSDVSNGYRKIVKNGNTGQRNSWSISNLPSDTYYWSVQTVDNAYTGSQFSTEQSFSYTAPPTDPPTALSATNLNFYDFNANWLANGGSLGFYLDVATDSLFTDFVTGYENLDVLDATSYTITGLEMGAKYYYQIRSYNADLLSSENSNWIEVQTLLSDYPVDVEILYNGSTVTISWSEYPNATSYNIYASETPYSGFVEVSSEGIFNGTSWSQIITGEKRFYYVVSVNSKQSK